MKDTPPRSRDDFLVFGSPAVEVPEIEEVVASVKSGWCGTRPKVARFELDFATFEGVSSNNVTAVSS